MPRIRSVHPELCDDDVLAGVSAYAERTWIRLWTHLDDKGRGLDSAKLWAGKLYPLHDSMTAERVEKDLAELEAKGLLQRYEVDGKRYLCCKLAAWERWQRPQKPTPSRLPEPPRGESRSPLGAAIDVGEGSRSDIGNGGESEGRVNLSVVHPQAEVMAQRAAAFASPT